jgi:hypothetical protein
MVDPVRGLVPHLRKIKRSSESRILQNKENDSVLEFPLEHICCEIRHLMTDIDTPQRRVPSSFERSIISLSHESRAECYRRCGREKY